MLTTGFVLSLIASIVQALLIVRLCFIRRHREYPLFLAYNAVAIAGFVAVVGTMRHAVLSYLIYWVGEAFANILALMVLLAVFKPAAEVIYMRRPLYRMFLPTAAVVVVAISISQAVYRPLRHSLLGHVASGIYSFVLGILCLEVLILITCVILSRSIPWTNYDFAIVTGFGISAMTQWVAYVVRWNYGSRFEDWFQILIPGAALCAAVTWLIAFLRSEPPTARREPDASELQKLIDLLREHTDFVRQILSDPRWRRQPVPRQSR